MLFISVLLLGPVLAWGLPVITEWGPGASISWGWSWSDSESSILFMISLMDLQPTFCFAEVCRWVIKNTWDVWQNNICGQTILKLSICQSMCSSSQQNHILKIIFGAMVRRWCRRYHHGVRCYQRVKPSVGELIIILISSHNKN